jgi:hypothetical protein
MDAVIVKLPDEKERNPLDVLVLLKDENILIVREPNGQLSVQKVPVDLKYEVVRRIKVSDRGVAAARMQLVTTGQIENEIPTK